MILTTLFGVFMLAIGSLTFFVLVRGGHTEKVDLIGWAGATLAIISSALILIPGAIMAGVLDDVAIAIATIGGCAALVGGVVYYVKHRPATFDTEPMEAPQTQRQTNYVTPGQYAAEAPAMRKRGRF